MMKNIYCNYIQPFLGCELFSTYHWLKPITNYILPIRAMKQNQILSKIIENATAEYPQKENVICWGLGYENEKH